MAGLVNLKLCEKIKESLKPEDAFIV